MELAMRKLNIGCFHKVWEDNFVREETTEAVVSDVLPDIGTIVDVSGVVCLRSKEAKQGECGLAATVHAAVIYQPEGERRMRKLEVALPITASAEAGAVDESCSLVVRLKLCSIDAKAVNPRKVLLRAEVYVEMAAFREGQIGIVGALEDAGGFQVNVKEGTAEFTAAVTVREKTFVLSDEYNLPASRPPMSELLAKRAELSLEDVKSVGNKLIFKGAALLTLLYVAAGEAELQSVDFSTGFSQIIEMERPMDGLHVNLSMALTGIYLDQMGPESRQISVELHIVAQAVGEEDIRLPFVEDAYCNEHPLSLSRDSLELRRSERPLSLRETLREQLETQSPARELICAWALPSPVSVEDGNLRADVIVRALYRAEDGAVGAAGGRYTVKAQAPAEGGIKFTNCAVTCTETYAAPSSGGLELRVLLDFTASAVRDLRIDPVSAMNLDTEAQPSMQNRPSVTVLPARQQHSVWALAKKYGSTPDLIRAANEIGEADNIGGKLLLIPRAR
ncbi:MAG: DUF3794 domain-containing protein [Firmicutes bacterium]|nr:DUF3794 domain-containing protein [Bacillota bacterium]